MNNLIIILQQFKKPDREFLREKECLICLETLDSEPITNLVMLPCECSNSTFHINCIRTMLETGENKNFCPHCKTVYQLQQPVQPNLEDRRQKQYSYIMIIHILSNSMMNIINISIMDEYTDNIMSRIVSKLLLVFYFCKILINACILFYLKTDVDSLKSNLCVSYTIQTMMFVLLICLISSIENDFTSMILLSNNIVFNFSDLGFRITIEYRCIE